MDEIKFTPELLGRRSVHPFPARMAITIPWNILSPRRGRLRVLDPMAGSGTSLIVGRAAGHATFGVDSDPLAVLISKVATADAKLSRIEERGKDILRSATRMEVTGKQAYPLNADEETRNFVRYWFDLEARKQLTALVRAIRMQSDLENEMNLKEDQALILELGEDETASRQAATTIGQSLPKQNGGTVVI